VGTGAADVEEQADQLYTDSPQSMDGAGQLEFEGSNGAAAQ